MNQQLLIEAVVVGATLALVLMAAHAVYTPKSVTQVMVMGFVVGVLIHLGFEAAGLNKMYCRMGAACR